MVTSTFQRKHENVDRVLLSHNTQTTNNIEHHLMIEFWHGKLIIVYKIQIKGWMILGHYRKTQVRVC